MANINTTQHFQITQTEYGDIQKTFRKTIIAVTPDGLRILINGDPELIELMDGCFFDDNSEYGTLGKFPAEPGIYQCDITYEFSQGYYAGEIADGESERDFIPSNCKAMSLEVAQGELFTPEEIAWITAKPKPNEIAYLDNCVIDFLERELAKNKARLRWLGAQEGEAAK